MLMATHNTRILNTCTCTYMIITYICLVDVFLILIPFIACHDEVFLLFCTLVMISHDDIDYGIRYKQLILIASTAVLFTLNFQRALLTVTTIDQS